MPAPVLGRDFGRPAQIISARPQKRPNFHPHREKTLEAIEECEHEIDVGEITENGGQGHMAVVPEFQPPLCTETEPESNAQRRSRDRHQIRFAVIGGGGGSSFRDAPKMNTGFLLSASPKSACQRRNELSSWRTLKRTNLQTRHGNSHDSAIVHYGRPGTKFIGKISHRLSDQTTSSARRTKSTSNSWTSKSLGMRKSRIPSILCLMLQKPSTRALSASNFKNF